MNARPRQHPLVAARYMQAQATSNIEKRMSLTPILPAKKLVTACFRPKRHEIF